jgi:tetratricopeptide (TPR) repeat protein/tRNA A-37 threonylcarbamoyl transferase component Bud32
LINKRHLQIPPSGVEARSLMIGKTVSHYTILDELGRGGMGVVYKARDIKLDRFVAIKFLPQHLSADERATQRFTHEAKAASALDHSNIGAIYEIDKSQDGQTFIVMAYYDGETLRERIDRGGVDIGEALDIASQITSGLARAHEQGIVHRDIKPSNIIITRHGEAKIVDFGLAKLTGRTKLTKDGSMLGTVAYMSPEQARGEDVDERSDIFSVGTVMYELLTGETPFRGDHEAALLYEIVHEEPKALSSSGRDIPEEMQAIVGKALEKSIDRRYQSSEDLLKDLTALRRRLDSGVSEGSSGEAVSGSQPAKARVWRFVAIALAAVVVAVVVWIVLQRLRPAPPNGSVAVAVVDFQDLGNPDDFTRSAGIARLVQVGLIESGPCRVVSSQYLYDLRRRLFGSGRGPIEEDQALEVARESGATLLLSGQMISVGAEPYVIWQLVDTRSGKSVGARRVEGETLSTLADEVIAGVLPMLAKECGVMEPSLPPPVSEITTDSPEAYDHYMAGLLARENYHRQEATSEFEKAIELDSAFALAYFELSEMHHAVLGGIAQIDLRREYADKAWRHRARLGVKDRLRLEAWREEINDRIKEAVDIYREMLLRWPDDRDLIIELASKMFYYWRFEEGVDVSRQGIALYPDEWRFVSYLSNSLGILGRFEEALEVLRSYVGRHPGDARVWTEKAWIYLMMALPDSAETASRRALEIDADVARSRGYLAYCEYYRGDIHGAIEREKLIHERHEVDSGTRILWLTSIWFNPGLPWYYAESGRFEEALQCYDEARRYATAPHTEDVIEVRRGELLIRLGRAPEALRSAQYILDNSTIEDSRHRAILVKALALIALDSLEAARAAFEALFNAEDRFNRAHLFPNDRFRVELELAEGDHEAAIEILNEMERRGMPRIAGMHHVEWREALARAHRMAGRLSEAAAVHEKMLREIRGHFLSHYDLGQIYEEMGRVADARLQYEAFLEAWAEADEGLPQVEDAKARLAKLQAAKE